MFTQDHCRGPSSPARMKRTFPGAATGLWIGLAVAGALGAAPQAWAGARLAPLDPPSAQPAHFTRMTTHASGRILLVVNLEEAEDLRPVGPVQGQEGDMFAKVGNRRGLASAVRTETLDGELWLATAAPEAGPETRFASRDAAATTFQEGPASVASR